MTSGEKTWSRRLRSRRSRTRDVRHRRAARTGPSLAEIASRLEASYPAELGHLASFETEDVVDLRRKLTALLCLPGPDRRRLAEAARATAVAVWSWEGVADRIVALMGVQLEARS